MAAPHGKATHSPTTHSPTTAAAGHDVGLKAGAETGVGTRGDAAGASCADALGHTGGAVSVVSVDGVDAPQPALALTNMCASWTRWEGEARPVLTGITAAVHAGEVLAVVGPVASGKSTLLMARGKVVM